MPPVDSSRNLLFGLLALQNNFIDRDALLDAFNRWAPRQDATRWVKSLCERLRTCRPMTLRFLEALVAKHLEKFES